MNFLSSSNVSTREVVEELEKTKHSLQKSQNRLRNLSAAYKALEKEKKTLETTIAAISGGTNENEDENPDQPSEEAENNENNPKVAQLTAALAQMSNERAKMQETFQSDRKRIKAELEENISKLTSEVDHLQKQNESLEIELKQSETRLRDSVREMEAENSASKIANRELQKQLNSERRKVDDVESQLKKKNDAVSKLRSDLKEAYEVQKERASDTRLGELKTKYLQLDTKYKSKCIEVDQLIETIKLTELESAKKLEDYNSKTDESKLLMLNETKNRESRLAELEDKINDMTELCSQLEREKVIEMEKNIASQRIIEQLRNDLDAHANNEGKRDGRDYFELYMRAQDETKQIMMELEEKKIELIKTKADLASKSCVRVKSSEILDEKLNYQEDIKQLKASSIILKRKIEEQKLEIFNLNQSHQTEFEKQKLEAQRKCTEAESRANEKLSSFEEQLTNLRERSQKILMDKDEEIDIIRKELNELTLDKPDTDSFNQLLSKEDSNLDTSLIMYAEQLARKDVEINSLRGKRKELEGRVRQVQEKLVEATTDTVIWKEKFETLERDSSPASKEYLKNLVLQYLAVTDKSKKISMQTALMTILELTNDDIKQMKRKMSRK